MRVGLLVLGLIAVAGAATGGSWRDVQRSDTESAAQLYRSGTGFFITQTGDMLTSAHVVRKCGRIEVWPQGTASSIEAAIVSSDERLDVALLTTHYRADRIADFTIDPSRKHSRMMTIGYGFTASAPLEPVVTRGRIDAFVRSDGRDIAVLPARLYEGNSGGPVVDEQARVIGMVIGRYASDPELGVAVRGSELVRFVRAAHRTPEIAAGESARQDRRRISSRFPRWFSVSAGRAKVNRH